MVRILLVILLFSCTGCKFFAVSEAVSLCDRSNVYCGDNEQSEHDFKRSSMGSALASDVKDSAKFVADVADNANKTEGEKGEYPQYEACKEDEVIICSASKGCFCE